MSLCVLLGAGFSAAAGLPVMNSIFTDGVLPAHKASEINQLQLAKSNFNTWMIENPDGNTEKWLRFLYETRTTNLFGHTDCDHWFGAVKYILRKVSEIKEPKHAPYYYGCLLYTSPSPRDRG